jgi:hypothetical protein
LQVESPAAHALTHVEYDVHSPSSSHDVVCDAQVVDSAEVSQVVQLVVVVLPLHWPASHAWSAPHTTAHDPQWYGSLCVSKHPSGHIVSPPPGHPWKDALSLDAVDTWTQPTGCTVSAASDPWVDALLSQSSRSRVTLISSWDVPPAPIAALTTERGIWKLPLESVALHVAAPASPVTVIVIVSLPGAHPTGIGPVPKTVEAAIESRGGVVWRSDVAVNFSSN